MESQTHKRQVVLKSTPKSEAANLAREIHHHRRLHHPHITQLYEVIITEEKVWLVLEMCPNGELYDHVVTNRQLVESEAQRIFAQICGAVAYIHEQGVVHRDLKLENIFLDKRSNAKLGDFGFTREDDKNWLKTWCGSLSYCAPEIVRGDKYRGEAIDIWSLGIILFALLSGQLPFDEEDEAATRKLILETTQVYPPFFSDEVRNLLDLMLNKDATQRPSALEVLDHPFLSTHRASQLAHLDQQFVPTFTSKLERTILERMGVAGIEMDKVISSVMDYRCDSLCGWWWLSLQRERRRERRYRALSKRRSTDLGYDGISSGRQSRSRRASADYPASAQRGLGGYAFPSADSILTNEVANMATSTDTTQGSLREIAPRVPSKSDLFAPVVSEIPDTTSDSRLSSDLTPTATRTQHSLSREDSADRRKELGARKNGIMQSFKSWWADQTKSAKSDSAKPQGKLSPVLLRKVTQLRPATEETFIPIKQVLQLPVSNISSHSAPRPEMPTRPTYRRRKSSQISLNTTRGASHRKHNAELCMTQHDSDTATYPRSSSPAKSSSSVDRQFLRPNMHRTASASSAQSSIGSFRLTGQAGHSKASSTSSNSTFASTRSIRSPRNPLKVMPSTPPPFMIAHQGGHKERNVFDTSLAGANGPVAFASRKRAKRGVLLQTKKSGGQKRLEMKEIPIEEEEEEDGDAFVDIEEQDSVADDSGMQSKTRSLRDLAEEQEESDEGEHEGD